LVAEIGGNHEGHFESARKLTDLALGTGVDYVKFQLYRGDTLVSRLEGPDRNAHFKQFELSREQHIQLAERCRAAGVGYLASVWDVAFLEWIDPYLDIYKVGSGDLTAWPVLRSLVAMKKPIIMATGMATRDEVLESVRFMQSLDRRYRDPNRLALLQCTSMYPIADADAELGVMRQLREDTGLTVGYSDHTVGSRALVTAYALGAQILEFHFTDSREGKSFRDHKVSLTPDEVRALIAEIEKIDELKGTGEKRPLESEREHQISFRRAVYPAKDVRAGTVLTEENLICLRPNHGIDAREFDQVLGRKTTVDLQAHQRLEWGFLE